MLSPNDKTSFSFHSLFESLEDRVLFDGVPDATFVLPQVDAVEPVPAQIQSVQQVDEHGPRELVLIDAGVENGKELLASILESKPNSTLEIRVLDGNEDGISQITQLLAESDGRYDAIHIVSHGDQGEVVLGNTSLDNQNLNQYVDQLAKWSGALTEDADLLFYGCELAGNEEGQKFISSIGAITGADVAASDDVTGHAKQDGDWVLEFSSGQIESGTLAAYSWQGTLAVADSTLNIVSSGTPTWDADNSAGNDTDGDNKIIRSHDIISMEVFYNTDSGGASDLSFTSILPEGLVWDYVPAAAALDARTIIFDSVSGLEGGDMRGMLAYLPDVAGTFTSSVVFEARALGGEQATPLDDVFFEVNSTENATALVTEDFDFILSSAAHMDIQLLSPQFRGVFANAAGTQDGVVYTYSIGILGDHPVRTGSDAVKGSAPIEDDFTFDLDFSGVTAGATIFDWGALLGSTTESGLDGITRNYERFVDSSGAAATAWSHSSRPSGQTDEAGSTAWTEEHSTPDSGDWNIISSSGSVFTAQVTGADTSGSHFPTFGAGNAVIPAGDNWFTSAQVSVWIPVDEILPGEDGMTGTVDDGLLEITPVITNFDPDDAYGATNNFGDSGTEDTTNNGYTHTVYAFSLGGSTKYNSEVAHPTSGRWLDTSSYWSAGDAETSVGHLYEARVSSGQNAGVLSLEGLIFGDKFDNSATRITANSLAASSGNAWSRVYISGGLNSGSFLDYGTEYIIEFGTGGVNAAAGGWTDWDSMGDATLADNESIGGYWSEDPTDMMLGGNAYADGVRDSITKWRIKLLRDLEPGETMISLITMETIGHSTLDLGVNPGGNIIANFNAQSALFLRDDADLTNDWRTSEYDPLTNSFYTGGSAGHLNRGDRLWIVDANVDVDKTVVDLGAGNNYLAGSAATIQLEGTVTIPGPDTGNPALDVYVTDMLPDGLTVVGGSAQPPSGFTFTAGDGSTISVQAVEYYDPGTTSWSTTWTYGATGIRWYYGDVPLNTVLPTMTFDVLIPFDAMNGESWTNTAVASSLSDDTTEDYRSSSAGLVAVQVAAMSAGKFVVTPLVPEDTTIIYELGIANVSDDKDVPWFDLVDILPYDGDFEGSSFSGIYTEIGVTGLDPGLEVYVTTAAATLLDSQDGTVDGYGDPGTASDSWFVAEDTGIWSFTLDDVINMVSGAPTMDQITAIRVVSDKAIDPFLGPGESTKFFLELTPEGNVGIPSDFYTNKFTARTDPGALPLPVTSAAVTAVVVAPDIEIQKEVALDETHTNIDPTNDAHWGETVNFDDTDKAYFRIKVTNTGTADFLGATVTDNLPAGATLVGGTVASNGGDFSGFPSTWTFDLGAGATAYLIYQIDVNDSGLYPNTADVSATDAWGETVTDMDDAEANFVTEISAAKMQTNAVRSTTNPALFEVTYEVEILNSSIFDLANITLMEDLFGAFGAGFSSVLVPPAITSSSISGGGTSPTTNGGYNGNSDSNILNGDGLLRTGDSVTLTYTVLVDPALLPDPANTVNQVVAGGVTGGPGGTPTTDLSDDGSDPATDNPGERGDTGGTDDPTPLALPAIDLQKQIIGSPTPAISGVNGNYDVTYEFTITNSGTTNLDNIAAIEDFLANLGGAFVGIINGPTVLVTTATDNPDFHLPYDGGFTDANIFANAPTTNMFTYGGSNTNTTIGRTLYTSEQAYVIDPNQTYTLMADAFAGDGAGGNYDPASRNYLGFASYDIDGNFVSTYNYSRYSTAVDTTLAVALNPGDTTITLNDATGWQNAGVDHQRSIAWYGYTDSTGHTYDDYTYTRNYLSNAWAAGDISGNTITLRNPWTGPAIAAGDAVRNNNSGGSYQYSLLSNGHIDETGGTYSTDIGGEFIPNGANATTMWRPGTYEIRSLVLADWGTGTGTQLNVSDFKLVAANENLLEPGQQVTFQITVEIDPDAPGAIYDGVTGDGNNSLENQASITANDPFNGAMVGDTSDDPTDPTNAEYGNDSDPDDPTSLSIADIELTKTLVGTPVAASSGTFGNFDATYDLTITNYGNDDLDSLSLMEDFATQFGGAFVQIVSQSGAPATIVSSNATNAVEINSSYDGDNVTEIFDNSGANVNLLEMGQTITVRVIVEVNPDDSGANYIDGQLLNIAMTAGTGVETGSRVDDESDDTHDTDDTDPDGNNSPDDPTPLYIPAVGLTKAAGDATANGDNWDVTFTLVIENNGTTVLTNLNLVDDIASQFGNGFVSASGLAVQSFVGTGTPPTANGVWNTNTALNMLTSGSLEIGDSFEVEFVVTIDPDGVDSVSQALDNQAMITGDALDQDGNPLLDDMGVQITATDVSDNGLDPDSENGEDNADGTPGNDPTPIIIADIAVAKEVVGQPTLLSNGNFEATYQLVVENTGTVDLADLSLLEDIATQFGDPFIDAYDLTLSTPPSVSSSIALDTANWDGDGSIQIINQIIPSLLVVGDSFVFEFKVEIDPDAGGTASAPLENQVTAGGAAVDENGAPYLDSSNAPILASDLSDSGDDPSSENSSDLGDHGTSDDPTPIYIPSISLAKQASDAVANGDNWDVTFTFFVENTGTVDLNNLTLFDDIDMEFGNAFVSASGLAVQNFVGSGTTPTANAGWTGDTALNMLSGGQANVGDTFEVVFTITIDPDGVDSLSQALENQGVVGGDALDEDGNPILIGGLPLQTTDESDNGTDPNGENGEDDGDGVYGNDPTPIVIADISVAKEVVGIPAQLGNDNFNVTFQLVVENTGTVDLASLTLMDDIASQFGPAFVSAGNLTWVTMPSVSSSVTLDTVNWDGDVVVEMINQVVPTSLVVGDFFVIQIDVEIDPDATGTSGPLNNQATATGAAVDSGGNAILDSNGMEIVTSDDSDSGADTSSSNSGEPGDSGGSDDPTPLLLPALGVAKQANSVTVAMNGASELTGSFDIQYLVVIENTGTIELTNLQLLDDLTQLAHFGDAYDPTLLVDAMDRSGLVVGPALVSHTMAAPGDLPNLNAGFLGGGLQTGLFDGSSGALQTGEQIVVSFTIRIDVDELGDGDPDDATGVAPGNQVTGTADSSEGAVTDDSDNGLNPNTDNGSGTGTDDFTPLEVPQVRLWKSHSDAVSNGDGTSTITVELRVQNSGTVNLTNLTLFEDLETQFGAAFVAATDPTIVSGPSNIDSVIPASLINGGWNTDTSLDVFAAGETGEVLFARDEFTISFSVVVDPDLLDNDSDYLENNATVTGDGTNYDGVTIITVMDESGVDNGSGIDVDEPTSAIVPEIAVVKAAGDAVANGDNWDVTFTLIVENTGSIDLDSLTLFDDITSEFGDAFAGVSGLAVQNFSGAGTAPTANAAWLSDTALNMLSGGYLDPGDNFEVVFTVTLDPDGVDSTSDGLDNQATVGGRGVDQMGNPLMDSLDNELFTSDVSDSGTNPQGTNDGENGDTGSDSDPTPIIIADVSVAKEVLGTPTLLSNGNFSVVYQLVIENIGTVNLADVTLVDDLMTQFGASVFQGVSGLTMITAPTDGASSITLDPTNWDGTSATDMIDQSVTTNLLAIGDQFTIQFAVEVDAAAATGILDNQATVGGTGVDSMGVAYQDAGGMDITATDESDSGTTTADANSGEPGDTGGSDDPTPLYIPSIGLAKQASDAVANGENWDVTFTLVWENTGTVDLTNLTMFDDIESQFGNAFVSISGLIVQNFTGTGTTPTANAAWMTDSTQSMILGGRADVDDSFEVVFTVTIDPDGIDNVSQGLENQATTSGRALDENDNPLNDDMGNPVTATDVSDNGTNATSENGEDDMDGTFGNDPTPIVIADISVVKAVTGVPLALDNGNFEVTYQLVIENIGTVDLADLSLVEDLQLHFGSVFQAAGSLTLATGPTNMSSNIVLDSLNWDGDGVSEMIDQSAATLLAVGDSFVVTFTVEVDPDAIGAPATLENQVEVSGDAVDSNGNAINDAMGNQILTSDLSDDGTDPNSDNPSFQGDDGLGGTDDPTPLLIPDIGITKVAGDAVANGENWDVVFSLIYENTGTATLTNLTMLDNVAAQFGNAFVSATDPTVQNLNGAGGLPNVNPFWKNNMSSSMFTGGFLGVGSSFEIEFTVTIDPDGIDDLSQLLNNQATGVANGLNPDGTPMTDGGGNNVTATDESDNGTDPHGENGEDDMDGVLGNDPTPVIIADIGITKESFGSPVQLSNGNFEVVYQLVIENTGTVDLANLSLLEDLAMQYGSVYVDAHSLTLITGPADPNSSVVLDSGNWNGDGNTEMVDQLAATLLAVGDSFVIQFTVVVDPIAATAPLTNQVTVAGDAVDSSGNLLLDSSNNPITATDDSDSGANPNNDNPSAPGDTGGTDDPTPLYIPNIGLAKQAGDAVANGENWDVTFTLEWENTGTVDLANLTMLDDIASQFGNAFVSVRDLVVQNFVGTGVAPTANLAWLNDTSLSLINGGTGDIDDRFQVVFIVTIDPDGIDDVSQSLENSATAMGEALDEDGNPLYDVGGNPITATDDSDNGTDTTGENGEDDSDGTFANDPTPIVIADIAVAKEVFGAPTALGDGTFEVTYQLVIENTGTVDLANLSLLEDISAQFGAPFVSGGSLTLITGPTDSSSFIVLDSIGWDGDGVVEMIDQTAATRLAIGDSFIVQFKVVVDLDASGTSGPLDNQVTASGDAVDSSGTLITDSAGNEITATDDSDSGADANGSNPYEQGDAGSADDPTPLLIPDLAIAKSASDAIANGNNWDVTFTIVFENTGTATLDGLTLTDDIMAEFGNAFVSTTGVTIQNLAGTGSLPVANNVWSNGTTASLIVGGSLDAGASFEVVFTVTIDPDGIDSLSQGLMNQAVATGNGVNPDGTPLTDGSGTQLTATDESDNGTNPNDENGTEDTTDGILANDPTPVVIADISLAKSAVGQPTQLANGNFSVTFQLVVENTGTVDLANLSLLEDIASQFGGAYVNASGLQITVPPSALASLVTLDSNWNGNSVAEMVDGGSASLLKVGDSFTLEFDVEVDASAVPPATTLANSVTAAGDAVDSSGNLITNSSGQTLTATDESDSGADPSSTNTGEPGDSFGSDDPTPLYIPSVGLAKSAGDAVANGDNWDITFTLVFENNGTVSLTNLAMFDDIASQFGGAFVTVGGLAIQNFVGTGTVPTVNGAWASDTSQTMIAGGLANVGDTFEVVYTVTIDPDAIADAGSLDNQASTSGEALDENGDPLLSDNGDPISATDDSDNGFNPSDENGVWETNDGVYANDPTPIQIADLAIAKSIVGEPELLFSGNYVVVYQLVVENTGTLDLAGLSLLEDLSTQFGAAFVNAGNLTLTSSPTDPGSSITIDSAGWNGNSAVEMMDATASNVFAVGDAFTIEFTVEIDPKAVDGELVNQVVGTGDAIDENGNPVPDSNGNQLVANDLSDSGTVPASSNPTDPADNGTSDDPVPFTPPPVPLSDIAGTVFVDDNNNGTQEPGESGIEGVEVTLVGVDVFGNAVNITVLTDSEGRYSFTDLNAGNYRLLEMQPDGFDDGTDNGNSSWTIGNDEFSDIVLDWGQSFGTSTFAERSQGAAGNPPRLPALAPFFNSPIGNLLSRYVGGPGPIYSGTPIGGNANPLSLESGRPVLGGYSSRVETTCPEPVDTCPPPVDACGQSVESYAQPLNWTEQTFEQSDDCGCEGEVINDGQLMSNEVLSDENAVVENNLEQKHQADQVEQAERVDRVDQAEQVVPQISNVTSHEPSFLKRMSNWIRHQ